MVTRVDGRRTGYICDEHIVVHSLNCTLVTPVTLYITKLAFKQKLKYMHLTYVHTYIINK